MQVRLLLLPVMIGVLPNAVQCQNNPARQTVLAMTELSDSFEKIARSTTQAVVQVNVSGYTLSPDADAGAVVALSRERGVGSGVVISADGYIVTNAHVVHGGQKISVYFRNRDAGPAQDEGPNSWPARVIGVDTETDLAVVKVERTGLPFLTLGDSSRVRQGQIVLAFGSPLGLSNSMTMGVVSSPARQLSERDFMQYIQTDTPINPGNSGGPLVDANGQVVGINTMILTQSGGSEGIGLAIPSNMVGSVFKQLRASGRIRRGMIGVNAQLITPALVEGLALKRKRGVIVTDVGPGGPAEKGGLKMGDILLAIDGVPVRTPRELELRVFRASEGDVLHLSVSRQEDDSAIAVDITVAERPESGDKLAILTNPKDHLIPQLGVLGLTIDKSNLKLFSGLREEWGVAVTVQAPQPTAWTQRLGPGDVIHRLNGNMVLDLDSLRQTLNAMMSGAAIVLQVENGGAMRYVAFRAE
jgi:serine protease Do